MSDDPELAERQRLLAECVSSRDELLAAVRAFEEPIDNLQKLEHKARQLLAIAPQVLVLGLALTTTVALVRRRRLGLATFAGSAIDAYRLWRLVQQYRQLVQPPGATHTPTTTVRQVAPSNEGPLP